jgi:acyl-CoA thioesterase II
VSDDPQPLDALLNLLDLEPIEVNIFRGAQEPDRTGRVFGGQVLGQALMAAGRTVTLGSVHSLHAYFLRMGDPNLPILYEVDRIRDGRSFTTRRVVAIQHGQAILNMACSFHKDEPGIEHQFEMPDVPHADLVAPTADLAAAAPVPVPDWTVKNNAIEHRFVGELPWVQEDLSALVQRVWIRSSGALPDDPLLHACVAAYASDFSLLLVALTPHRDDIPRMATRASLDHCMWFHRPFRMDDWLLYDRDSPVAAGSRGLARGFLYDQAGTLVCSMVQEGLARLDDGR